jgi:hypothetical protein
MTQCTCRGRPSRKWLADCGLETWKMTGKWVLYWAAVGWCCHWHECVEGRGCAWGLVCQFFISEAIVLGELETVR